MKYLFTFIFLLLVSAELTAQLQAQCIGVTLSTQAQVDAFAQSGCTTISGSLAISGADITNLDGLSNLTRVDGYVSIQENASLISIAGLSRLTQVGDFLQIVRNGALTSLTGLNSLTSVGNYINVAGNANLTSIASLSGITQVRNSLQITGNGALTNLTGLSSVTSLRGSLAIIDNANLTSIASLSGITEVRDFIRIARNGALIDLTGLNNVTSVGNSLRIEDNASLTSIASLSGITQIGRDLIIAGNPALSVCAIPPICQYLADPAGDIIISDNAPGCATLAEVRANCQPPQPIRYVKQNGTGDGSSWQQASGDLQAMINTNGVQEVWVARGRYQPAAGGSFAMKEGVAIYGGFQGTELVRDDRPAVNPVIGGPSSSTLAGNGSSVIRNDGGLTNSARLDGFVITGGNAPNGGGIYNQNSSPSISNCLFEANTGNFGGGIYNQDSNPTISNCLLRGNRSIFVGGGIYNQNSSPRLINCILQGNQAGTAGGGIANQNSSSPTPSICTLINCTLSQNRSGTVGAALYNSLNCQSALINTILWDNQEASNNAIVNFNNTSSITANYCLIGEGETDYSGTGNVIANRSPFISDTDLRLNGCSQAIDAGDPASTTATSGATDLAGQPRIFGGRIDIGAYEYQAQPTVITVTTPMTTTAALGQAFNQVFSASGGQAPYSYSVISGSLPQGLTLSNTGNLTGMPTQTGSFSIIVQAQTEQGCTGLSGTYSLTVSNPIPTITGFAAIPNPVCAGSSVTFTATVGNVTVNYSYTLTNGEGVPLTGSMSGAGFSRSLTAGGSASQSYTLIVSSQGQQTTAMATTTLNVSPPPQVTLSSSGTLTCAQPSVNLLATGGDQGAVYRFSGPGQSGQPNSSSAVAVTTSGTYSVTVTTTTGCSATASTSVSQNTAPPTGVQLTSSGTLSANNPTVTLTASSNATANVGVSYEFSPPAQKINDNQARVTTSGNYSVTATRSDNGCTVTAQTAVLGASSVTACRGASATVNLTPAGSPVRYEWYVGVATGQPLRDGSVYQGAATANLRVVSVTQSQVYYAKVFYADGLSVVYGPYRVVLNTNCGAREAASVDSPSVELGAELRITLLGNPLQGEALKAIINGAAGQRLQVELVDQSGRSVRQQVFESAESAQAVEWNINNAGSGLYLLQAVSGQQRHTAKVVKP